MTKRLQRHLEGLYPRYTLQGKTFHSRDWQKSRLACSYYCPATQDTLDFRESTDRYQRHVLGSDLFKTGSRYRSGRMTRGSRILLLTVYEHLVVPPINLANFQKSSYLKQIIDWSVTRTPSVILLTPPRCQVDKKAVPMCKISCFAERIDLT